MKKIKQDGIEGDESEDEENHVKEEIAKTKWRDFKVHHLIAIQDKLDEEFQN